MLDEILVLHFLKQGIMRDLIHMYKYAYVEEAFNAFRVLFAAVHERFSEWFCGFDVIAFVPLHRRRFVERGFNQSEQIARIIADVTHIPVNKDLRRIRYTKKQSQTRSAQERQKNIAGAFVLDEELYASKRVLLVDDVYTTGHTLKACAQLILEKGKARKVSGFCLAKG